MNEAGRPGREVFTEADLQPSAAERAAGRLVMVERVAAAVAALALGAWAGGLVALGACAAPQVFSLVPPPLSGRTMGGAFARFDSVAIGCTLTALGCEVARSYIARRRASHWPARARRYLTMLAALLALYSGVWLSPTINALHAGGARRGVAADGAELERVHQRAELVGKLAVALAALLVLLHTLTMPTRDRDDEQVAAPLPPGPSGGAADG